MALGATQRPRDTREDKYALKAVLPMAAVDITRPRSLGEHRPPVGDQGSIGACAGVSSALAAQCAHSVAGGEELALHGGWLYMKARQKEGSFPVDAGSAPADNLDIMIDTGAPPLSDAPYVSNAAYQYPAYLDANAPAHRYVFSHHPFFPTDADWKEQLCAALDAGMPVSYSMAWAREFFAPVGGVLQGGSQQSVVGGHAIYVWGWEPRDGGYLLCANQWTPRWSADAPNFRADMRPGDFAVPAALVTAFGWEFRAITATPLPQPEPQPQPTPDPTPTPTPDPQPQPTPDPQPVPEDTRLHDALVDLFQWMRDLCAGDTSSIARIDGWENWVDTNARLK